MLAFRAQRVSLGPRERCSCCERSRTRSEDAYVTCSRAGDLKRFEVVDGGMWNDGFTLPLSILNGL
jgi:hypothetical protein